MKMTSPSRRSTYIALSVFLLINFSNGDSSNNTTASSAASASSLSGGCTQEGEEKKVTNGWATCHNGKYEMSACQADDGSKIEIGLNVRQRGFVFQCEQTSNTASSGIVLKPVACLRQKGSDGNFDKAVVVEPGQRVRESPFVYECVRILSFDPNMNSLSLKAVACTNQTGEIPDGGTVTVGAFTYNCSRTSGSLTNTVHEVFLQAKGCLYQGKEYAIDQQAIIGSFAYKCRTTSGWPSALEFAVVGCANEGRRYDDGEKYQIQRSNESNSRYVMQCRRTNNSWASIPAGCVQDGNPPTERAIGDTWIDNGGPGDARLKYVMVCRGDAMSVQPTISQCIYQPNVNDPNSGATINPGCMKKFTKPTALVKCIKDPSDAISTEVLYRLNLNKVEQEAYAQGLKYC